MLVRLSAGVCRCLPVKSTGAPAILLSVADFVPLKKSGCGLPRYHEARPMLCPSKLSVIRIVEK